jgi:DnaJ-class molecular chaperone
MGHGYIECPECEGSGEAWPECISHGVLRDIPNVCSECEGSGKVKCPECDGEGEV